MKIDSNIILYIIYVLGAFTLYYTWQNDFNVFLLTLLLMLGALWCYLYVNEIITGWENKIDKIEKIVEVKIDNFINRIEAIKNLSQQFRNIKNINNDNQ